MDYDNYNAYERNFSSGTREEAEFARERSRRFDRERREREADMQWEMDRSLERQFGFENRESFTDESRRFGENSRRYDDSDYFGKDKSWDDDTIVPSYDYNHGMSSAKERDDLPRSGAIQRHSETSDAGGNRGVRPGVLGYTKEECTSTIFLGGIPKSLDEADIEREVLRCGIDARDVRIIRQKETGANRGFAFVDFHSVADAQKWMELNQVYKSSLSFCHFEYCVGMKKGCR